MNCSWVRDKFDVVVILFPTAFSLLETGWIHLILIIVAIY